MKRTRAKAKVDEHVASRQVATAFLISHYACLRSAADEAPDREVFWLSLFSSLAGFTKRDTGDATMLRKLSGLFPNVGGRNRSARCCREALTVRFFTGLHQPADAQHFNAAFISVNRLRTRKGFLPVGGDWIMDSGAFTEIATHGRYRHDVAEYATEIRRWKSSPTLLAAIAQDYMCEPHMLEKTGLTVADHQRLTVERYDALIEQDTGVYIMPVLQGYAPAEYVDHVRQYGTRLALGAWVGVGSICKRNGDPRAIEAVLHAIKTERPDLRLHGFGLKHTALASPLVRQLLETADSMAWSFAARRQGRNGNDWREAVRWARGIHDTPHQLGLSLNNGGTA